MRAPVVVCGLGAEAKALSRGFAQAARRDGAGGVGRDAAAPHFLTGGGDQARLARDLAGLAAEATAFISLGIAGGLAAGLRPGDIRVASRVTTPAGDLFHPDRRWAEALAARLGATLATFVGVDQPVLTTSAKAALHRDGGADLVDMESHVVARAAAAQGKPFAAVRVVSDRAEQSLPPAAAVGMRADGGIDLPAILLSLGRDPAQIPALIRTGLDARLAFAGLFRCGQLLGPGLAFLDLGEPLTHVT